MGAPDKVLRLVENFHRNIEAYKSGKYNETQVRREYIDPLFSALGWDVGNTAGHAEAYKDVIHEDAIRIGGSVKAPDYCFRIGGTRKFFLEAKKPSVSLKEAKDPAFQLRRYAWSAKLPLSILTDFEEFAVYDCRVRPVKTDAPTKARTMFLTYREYESKWDEIDEIFSKKAVLQGSFDKYVESNKKKRGTAAVDDAFLEEIEAWRELLAKNIALRNKNLSQRELNTAIQRTIDRIIFLRICEDRGIEHYAQLQGLLSGPDTYNRLATLFHRADDRYNSGLFHFSKEKGRVEHDDWTLKLVIDDKVLQEILKGLYYPDSPYEFSVLPADILGQVYEQFLGKVIRLTKGHRAVVEDKPEVKKAGGVYYTPTYIVDYIVEHTVGKLLENLTPKQAMGKGRKKEHKHPIRVLDPACGSGSFLIGAYQCLLDWYRKEYAKTPEEHTKGKNPRIFQDASREGEAPAEPLSTTSETSGSAGASPSHHDSPSPGVTPAQHAASTPNYRLTTAERKRILLDHIYGVDIDTQAVEVTKLSLLLKCLEGENSETLGKNLALFHARALPDLADNIKCGNSLIGTDFYANTQLDMLDEETRYRINAFDWDKEFPEVFETGETPGLWFVTFVTHNSRVSERMVRFGVTDEAGKGLQPLVFSPNEQILVAQCLLDTASRHGFAFISLNVLPDHVHAVLPAPDEDVLNKRVGLLKTFSAKAVNDCRENEKGTHVWAQKFNRKAIHDSNALAEICNYVNENHDKHEERWGKRFVKTSDADLPRGAGQEKGKGLQPLVSVLQPLIRESCVSPDEALVSHAGGFDAVIGNPPYIRIQTMKEWAPVEVEHYKTSYRAAAKGNFDIYVLFAERGLQLLNPKGRLGFILPHKFFNAKYGEALRKLVAEGEHLAQVVHFADQQIFTGATTYTCLMFLDKPGVDECFFTKVSDLESWRCGTREGAAPSKLGSSPKRGSDGASPSHSTTGLIPASHITRSEWNFVVGRRADLFQKLTGEAVTLGDVAKMSVGLQTSADTVFLFKETKGISANVTEVFSKELRREVEIESELLKPVVRSGSIGRYFATPTAHVLFPYYLRSGSAQLIPEADMNEKYPKAWDYLQKNKSILSGREHGKFRASGWYQLYPKNLDLWERPKILMPYMITHLAAFYDTANNYFVNVTTGGFAISINEQHGSLQYFTGLLNSRLLDLFFKEVSTTFHGGYFAANKQFLVQLPIRPADLSRPDDKACHDKMVKLVERMLDLHTRLAKAKTGHDKTTLQRQIDATDAQIDTLVYELYGLTDDEIKIVEEATK